jgi:hypothetical protein
MWWDGVNPLTFQTWKSTWKYDSQSLFVDPKLADPLNKDLHLRMDSPCIDAGTDVGLESDFDGRTIPKGFAPDIGAYEIAKPLYAKAMASPTSEKDPLSFVFTAIAEGDFPPFFFDWNFGDGETSAFQNPSHTYKKMGRYKATLTITDRQSNRASISLLLKTFRRQNFPQTARSAKPRSEGKKLTPKKKQYFSLN